MLRTISFLAALALGQSAAPAQPDYWPQWRGPGGLGIAQGTYPDSWSASKNVAWKTEIPGRGYSAPVVWGDRVFLTTSIAGRQYPGRLAPDHLGFDLEPGYLHPDSVGVDYAHTLKVLALDAATGVIAWERTVYDGPVFDNRHRKNTYASSTVVTDGEAVFASFESEGLYAFDFEGNLLWKASFAGMPKAGLGPGTSPILHGDLLIVQGDQEMGNGSFIAALDRTTGAVVWYTQRANRRSWATPLLVRADGRDVLLASGAEAVIAYDPVTGRELWRTDGTVSHPIPSIVAGDGMAFATAGSQRKVALAIRLNEPDRIAWPYEKGTAYVPSPILYDGILYLVTDRGIVTALDPARGELVYEGGRVPVPATFTSSPVAFDGKILLTSEDGDTFALRAGPTHEVLRTYSLGEPVFASPGLADGTIYIRGARHLFAIREPAAPRGGAAPTTARDGSLVCTLSPAADGAMTGPCATPAGDASLTLREGGDDGDPIWIGALLLDGYEAPADLKWIEHADGSQLAFRTPFGWFPAELSRSADTLTVTYRSVEMQPSPTDLQILARAREILDQESAWDRADDRVCESDDVTFSLYCALHRAAVDVTGEFHHRQPALQAVRVVVQQMWSNRWADHRLMDFNNHPDTTLVDIQATLEAAEQRIRSASG